MRIPNSMLSIPMAFAAAALASMLLITATATATAQTICGDRAWLLKQLARDYNESPISMGLAANGSVVEVTKSEKGTWTILLTYPTGMTCVVTAGENWEILKQKKTSHQPS